jgi:uncharacterized protein
MNTKLTLSLAIALLCFGIQAQAQTAAAAPASASSGPSGVIKSAQALNNHPLRQPNLADAPGAVPWSVLSNVRLKTVGGRLMPDYPPAVRSFNSRDVKVQGFMIPLEPGDKQSHFLLTNVPTSCSFCMPAGPEGMIEVRAKTPVKYSTDPVTVEGKFAVLERDPTGMYYRLTAAQVAK